MLRYVSVIGCVFAFLIGGSPGLPADDKGEQGVLYEVPTTGKILDVTYMPEFDEWWVKCREGDSISVYSYDRQHRKWGRARFIPVPAATKASKTQDAAKAQAGTTADQAAAPPVEEDQKKPKPEQTEPETKSPQEKAPPDRKKNWWNPLRFFKEKK